VTVFRRRSALCFVAVVFLLVLGLAPSASAAGPGFFSTTGSLSVSRNDAAAAPLPDGRVLVAGGFHESSAEIFDPATGTFSSAGIGPMTVDRYKAAAAPLPDGRVLIAGGESTEGSPLSSAEIFDPATNTFSSAGIGSMTVARWDAAAAPLPDGRVLIVGGCCGASTRSSAEVFNPATNTFSSAGIGSTSDPREGAVAAPLSDGRVLVTGGAGGGSSFAQPSAEVFDPATGTFSSAGIGSMALGRQDAVAAPLPDGRVLVAGGAQEHLYPCYLSSAEVFDPATSSFSHDGIGSMAVPREHAVAAPLPDGVLVAGGSYGVDFLGRGCPAEYTGDSSTCAEIFKLGVPSRQIDNCNPEDRSLSIPTGQRAAVLAGCRKRYKAALRKKQAQDALTNHVRNHLKNKLTKCKRKALERPF
jgi:Galactose oxidase, central domain/Kelch motif